MPRKTRKNYKSTTTKCTDAKKGTQIHCRIKTTKAQKYKSVYGATGGGSIRSNSHWFY